MTDSKASPLRTGCTVAAVIAALLAAGSLAVLCAVPYVGGRLENAGPISLTDVDATWEVRGEPTLSAVTLAQDVMRDCQPMGNGVNVAFQHTWYNLLTSGYDSQHWLKGPPGSYDSYALYRWSNRVFLRDEVREGGYDNQVLVCDTSSWSW